MPIIIPFQNPKNREIKKVKLGRAFNFFFPTVLLFGCFGIPLFLRQLYSWGAIYALLTVIILIGFNSAKDSPLADAGGYAIIIAFLLSSWLAGKVNEMTAKNYLRLGWKFAEPNNDFTKAAKQQWKIA